VIAFIDEEQLFFQNNDNGGTKEGIAGGKQEQ
jgi:hypothetical protein